MTRPTISIAGDRSLTGCPLVVAPKAIGAATVRERFAAFITEHTPRSREKDHDLIRWEVSPESAERPRRAHQPIGRSSARRKRGLILRFSTAPLEPQPSRRGRNESKLVCSTGQSRSHAPAIDASPIAWCNAKPARSFPRVVSFGGRTFQQFCREAGSAGLGSRAVPKETLAWAKHLLRHPCASAPGEHCPLGNRAEFAASQELS